MSEVPELQTERLLMRAWRDEDFEPFAAILADPAVARGLGKEEGMTRQEAWRDMSMMAGHWALKGFGHWVLEERGSGELVAAPGSTSRPRGPRSRSAGRCPGALGQGYAGEAGTCRVRVGARRSARGTSSA